MNPGKDGIRDTLLDAAVGLLRRSDRGGIMRLAGESMRPTLRPGQLIAIEFAPADPCRGDVLVFRQGEHLLVHRLLGPARSTRKVRGFRTRGDGTPALDPVVEEERILGRVIAVEVDGAWRSTRAVRARLYGRCLGWHHLFWTAAGLAGGRIDRGLEKLGLRATARPAIFRLDGWLLHVGHALFFRLLHPRTAPPEGAGD